ncbi:HAD family hydrolase [Vibrio sinaloensis]|uniref:HAD family hydrolase n=1 Tax=Photobacterium sp. (strain ATCC 43367) TaxID=379097 RepID=UPI0035EB2EAF
MEIVVKEYQAYLFDMDGTLVNSEPLKGMALAQACNDYGAKVDFNIYKEVMGESWPVVTGHFFHHAGISPELAEFNTYFRAHYEALLAKQLELNEGAKEYLLALKQQGKICGVVSSAATWMVENILQSLDLNDMFDVVITQEHVTKHKPDPEAYFLALEHLNLDADSTVIFEDSAAGVAAGIEAGCDVVAIQHEFNGKNDLSGAILQIDRYQQVNELSGTL